MYFFSKLSTIFLRSLSLSFFHPPPFLSNINKLRENVLVNHWSQIYLSQSLPSSFFLVWPVSTLSFNPLHFPIVSHSFCLCLYLCLSHSLFFTLSLSDYFSVSISYISRQRWEGLHVRTNRFGPLCIWREPVSCSTRLRAQLPRRTRHLQVLVISQLQLMLGGGVAWPPKMSK